MNHAGETKLLQANWRITLEIPDCLRQIDVFHWKWKIASGKLIFSAWFFNFPEAFCSRRWKHSFALRNWMSTEWFFHTLKAFSRITYWRDAFLEAMVRRRLDSSVRLRLFLVSRIEGIHFLKRWSVDDLILLSAWGFFSYHILKEYISWSYGVSTTWLLCPPEAFSRITYWRDTFLEAMVRRRVDSSVRLRLFLVSHIEGIHFLKRWSVEELISPSA